MANADYVLIRTLEQQDAMQLVLLVSAYQKLMSEKRTYLKMNKMQAAIMIDRAITTRNIVLLGAETAAGLVGFAYAFDLPEIISGKRAGQLDDLYVAPQGRRIGAATALIEALTKIGRERGWTHLRWLVPNDNIPARTFYEKIARNAPWNSFYIDLSV